MEGHRGRGAQLSHTGCVAWQLPMCAPVVGTLPLLHMAGSLHKQRMLAVAL
jgi:hypothetical protein